MITDGAGQALQAALADEQADGIVRISEAGTPRGDGAAPPGFRLQVGGTHEADDEVVTAPGGVQVCIEAAAARHLDGRVLDGSLDAGGHPSFVLSTERSA